LRLAKLSLAAQNVELQNARRRAVACRSAAVPWAATRHQTGEPIAVDRPVVCRVVCTRSRGLRQVG